MKKSLPNTRTQSVQKYIGFKLYLLFTYDSALIYTYTYN